MNERAISVLRAIVEEVAGHSQPYSADSYLPAHLIHDARHLIEQHERRHEEHGIRMYLSEKQDEILNKIANGD